MVFTFISYRLLWLFTWSESLIEEKIIQNKSDVIDYLIGIIFNGSCKNDVIFIKCTYEGLELNDYIMALCASKERKIETLALGNRRKNFKR